jgi:hypothetical protein
MGVGVRMILAGQATVGQLHILKGYRPVEPQDLEGI